MFKKLICPFLALSMLLPLASCGAQTEANKSVEASPAQSLTPPERVLFIGNSATYVNDIPGTLSRLAQGAGYSIQCDSVTKGGAFLTTFSDPSTEIGSLVRIALKNGYDLVILQDNGGVIESEDTRFASVMACETLAQEIIDSGAGVGLYLRAPYGYANWGYEPAEQTEQFDEHYLGIAETVNSSVNVFVNRAFTVAMEETVFNLFADDNSHTNAYGGYLAVCVFFATLFGTSSTVLDANGLPEADARILQQIADRVALEGYIPY